MTKHEQYATAQDVIASIGKGRMLKVSAIAEILDVAPMTVYRLIRAGRLPAADVGTSTGDDAYGLVRVWEKDFTDFLGESAVTAGTPGVIAGEDGAADGSRPVTEAPARPSPDARTNFPGTPDGTCKI